MRDGQPLFYSTVHSFLGAAVLAACITGCGGASDAPDRWGIYGKVTFDGKPVPSGMIVFEDVVTLDRTACSIDDGYYENQSGKGHQGGKFKVMIDGREAPPGGGVEGARLWKGTWITEIEVPKESTEKDFEITKENVEAAPAESVNPADET